MKGPMIVPMDHTKGITEKARATELAQCEAWWSEERILTLMLRLGDQFTNHGLDDADVAVKKTADGSASQSNPDVGGEADHDHAEHSADASQEKYGFSSDTVRETAPVHAHQGLREGEGGDEEAGVEGCIFSVADFESLDEGPGVGEDGGECDGLGETNDR